MKTVLSLVVASMMLASPVLACSGKKRRQGSQVRCQDQDRRQGSGRQKDYLSLASQRLKPAFPRADF